ncbi:hypothetical protein [Vibrio salinus]|uniref:hypothetical protein n=1 Tax=Vibrio salinus TaxID=2899784 RepID=UPI001E4D42DF|nr:hypothetical protein [Vibrio salinus]MCE0495945.1 hypothetical protein [Vibrio salinus]
MSIFRIFILFLSLWACSLPTSAQQPKQEITHDFHVEILQLPKRSDAFFPFVSSKKYPRSAAKINTMLQFMIFEKPVKRRDFLKPSTSPFNRNESPWTSIYSVGSKEFTNFLSITIDGEGCGAYCEGFSYTLHFDKYSGQMLTLPDFFTPDKLKQLEDKLRAVNLKKIEPYLQDPPVRNDKEEINGDFTDYDVYQMYQSCYDDLKKPPYLTLDSETNFSLSQQSLEITHGRCSNHAMRALDEIGSFTNTLTLKEFSPYLSDAGKQYLSTTPYQMPAFHSAFPVWSGKIANRYPVTFIKARYTRWHYWYDKYQTPIELVENGRDPSHPQILKWVERKYDNQKRNWITTALIQLRFKDKTATGTYLRLSDKKTLPIILHE